MSENFLVSSAHAGIPAMLPSTKARWQGLPGSRTFSHSRPHLVFSALNTTLLSPLPLPRLPLCLHLHRLVASRDPPNALMCMWSCARCSSQFAVKPGLQPGITRCHPLAACGDGENSCGVVWCGVVSCLVVCVSVSLFDSVYSFLYISVSSSLCFACTPSLLFARA